MLASMWMAYKQQTETERYYFNGTNLPLPLSPLLCHTYQYRLNSFLDVLQQESRQNQREFETKNYTELYNSCVFFTYLSYGFILFLRREKNPLFGKVGFALRAFVCYFPSIGLSGSLVLVFVAVVAVICMSSSDYRVVFHYIYTLFLLL